MTELTTDERVVQTHRRALLTVQTLLICSVSAILIPWYAMLIGQVYGTRGSPWLDLLVPLFFSPLWLPSMWAAWKLRKKSDIFGITSGLSIASGWSLFAAIVSLFVLMPSGHGDISFGEALFPLLVLSIQFATLPLATRSYRKLLLACGEKSWPWTGLGIGLFAAIPLLLLFMQLSHGDGPLYEASAVGSLRTISIAQADYANLHPETGFAISLMELGPTPGANLIDSTLTSGKKAAYIFTLEASAPDIEGRIASYTVTATPAKLKEETSRSFFIDETGLLHFTKEHRAATANDPLLQ